MTNDNSDRFDIGRRPVLGGIAGALSTGPSAVLRRPVGTITTNPLTNRRRKNWRLNRPKRFRTNSRTTSTSSTTRTLEYLEATFYTRGIRNIDESALEQHFAEWGPIGDRVLNRILNRLRVVRDHEIRHVEVPHRDG